MIKYLKTTRFCPIVAQRFLPIFLLTNDSAIHPSAFPLLVVAKLTFFILFSILLIDGIFVLLFVHIVSLLPTSFFSALSFTHGLHVSGFSFHFVVVVFVFT